MSVSMSMSVSVSVSLGEIFTLVYIIHVLSTGINIYHYELRVSKLSKLYKHRESDA